MVFHEFIFVQNIEKLDIGKKKSEKIFAVCLNKALGNVSCDDTESYNETGKP